MKKILLFALMFMFTASAGAKSIEQQIRLSPEANAQCVEKIAQNEDRVELYQGRIDASLAAGIRPKLLNKIKRNHFQAELQNWLDYCSGNVEPDA